MDSNGGPSAGSPSELDSLPAGYTFFDRVLLTSMRRTDQFILGFSGQRRGEQYVLCVMVTDMGRRGWAAEVDIHDLEQWFKVNPPPPPATPSRTASPSPHISFTLITSLSPIPTCYSTTTPQYSRTPSTLHPYRHDTPHPIHPPGKSSSPPTLSSSLLPLGCAQDRGPTPSPLSQLLDWLELAFARDRGRLVEGPGGGRQWLPRPAPAPGGSPAAGQAPRPDPQVGPGPGLRCNAVACRRVGSWGRQQQEQGGGGGGAAAWQGAAQQRGLPLEGCLQPLGEEELQRRCYWAMVSQLASCRVLANRLEQLEQQRLTEASTSTSEVVQLRGQVAALTEQNKTTRVNANLHDRRTVDRGVPAPAQRAAQAAATARSTQPLGSPQTSASRRASASGSAASALLRRQAPISMVDPAHQPLLPPPEVPGASTVTIAELRAELARATATAEQSLTLAPAQQPPLQAAAELALPSTAHARSVHQRDATAVPSHQPSCLRLRTGVKRSRAQLAMCRNSRQRDDRPESAAGDGACSSYLASRSERPGLEPVLEVLVQDAPAASHPLDALDAAPAGPAAPAAPDMEPHRSALHAVHAGDTPGLAAAAGGGGQPRASLTVLPAGLGPADPCLPKPSAAGEVPASRSEGRPLQACDVLKGSQPRMSLGAAAATLAGGVDAHQPQACGSKVARPEAVGGAAAHDRSSPSAPPLPAPIGFNPRAVTVDSCVPAAPQPLRPNASLPRNAALQSSPLGAGDGADPGPALEMRRPRGSPLTLAEAFGVEEWPGTSRCAVSGVRGPKIAAGSPGGGAGAGGVGGAGTRGAAVGVQGSHDKATPGGHVGALAKAAAGISTPGSATCTQQQQQQQQQHEPQSLRKRLFVEMDLTQGYCPAQRKSGRLAGPQLTQEPARDPGQPAVTPPLPAPATGAVPHDPLDSVLAEPQGHVPAAASPHVLTAPAVAAAPAASVAATAAQAAALPAVSGAEAGLVRPGTAAGIQTGNLPVTAVPCRVAPGLPRTFVDAMLDEIGGEPPPLPTSSGVTAQRRALSARHPPGEHDRRLGLSLGDASGANVLRAVAESPPWSLPARALAPGVGWPGPDTQGHPQPAQVKSSSTVAISASNSTGIEVTQRLGGAPSRG
ncbi:hypothetical protein QJQ45_018575 [Haematococcus lacustris]|nr:hypothetical protein QJQ45_018575 [Haematococcus lacustris]